MLQGCALLFGTIRLLIDVQIFGGRDLGLHLLFSPLILRENRNDYADRDNALQNLIFIKTI